MLVIFCFWRRANARAAPNFHYTTLLAKSQEFFRKKMHKSKIPFLCILTSARAKKFFKKF
jgi:hypothetical protein